MRAIHNADEKVIRGMISTTPYPMLSVEDNCDRMSAKSHYQLACEVRAQFYAKDELHVYNHTIPYPPGALVNDNSGSEAIISIISMPCSQPIY